MRYSLQRIGQAVPLLLLVAVLIFGMTRLMPGDPATTILGSDATDADITELQQRLGLDQPLLEQFFTWLLGFIGGDLGKSYITGRPVAGMLGEALPVTLSLAIGGTLVCLLIGIPFALAAGANRKRLPDYGVLTGSLIGISVPSFVLGIVLVLIFAIWLRWLPSQGYVPLFDDPSKAIRHLVLPSLSLGLMNAAIVARIGRASVIEVLGSDYIVTARATRVSRWSFYLRHVLRNALIPIMTVVGLTFGTLIGGAVVTERVFNMQGIGTLVLDAISRRDYPVIQAAIFLVSVSYILINLIIDLLYVVVDPRVRFDD